MSRAVFARRFYCTKATDPYLWKNKYFNLTGSLLLEDDIDWVFLSLEISGGNLKKKL